VEIPWSAPRGDSIAPPPTSPRGSLRDAQAPSRRFPRHGVGRFNPHRQGAVGPPRSGFVLRLCIRKADGARGEAALGYGLADTRFCRTRIAEPAVTRGSWLLPVSSQNGASAGLNPTFSSNDCRTSKPTCSWGPCRGPAHLPSPCGEDNFWQVLLRLIAASLPLPLILAESAPAPSASVYTVPGCAPSRRPGSAFWSPRPHSGRSPARSPARGWGPHRRARCAPGP
jgi:hypothetical protein